ncbi:MAG TPA: hypothetical protein VFJ58_10080 [Armatimonadota bacterium]|nr:hypothetical protein [Armatimonadota bacterium]
MALRTIKVTGVSEELLRLLDDRIRVRHATGRSEYIRELIRKDLLDHAASGAPAAPRTFRDLLEPVAQETRRLGDTEEETEEFLRRELEAHRRERRSRTPPMPGE